MWRVVLPLHSSKVSASKLIIADHFLYAHDRPLRYDRSTEAYLDKMVTEMNEGLEFHHRINGKEAR